MKRSTKKDIHNFCCDAALEKAQLAELDSSKLIMWCKTHDWPAILYDDGSISCWWEDIVEIKEDIHDLVETPAETKVRELEKDKQNMIETTRRYRERWRILRNKINTLTKQDQDSLNIILHLQKQLRKIKTTVEIGANEGPVYCEKPECIVADIKSILAKTYNKGEQDKC